jgi:hypothetical protein
MWKCERVRRVVAVCKTAYLSARGFLRSLLILSLGIELTRPSFSVQEPRTAIVGRSDDFAFQSPHKVTKFAARPVEPREGGSCVVLNSVSEQIRECLRHAEDCARKAAEFPNGAIPLVTN